MSVQTGLTQVYNFVETIMKFSEFEMFISGHILTFCVTVVQIT